MSAVHMMLHLNSLEPDRKESGATLLK